MLKPSKTILILAEATYEHYAKYEISYEDYTAKVEELTAKFDKLLKAGKVTQDEYDRAVAAFNTEDAAAENEKRNSFAPPEVPVPEA